jgi:hypothetical protein
MDKSELQDSHSNPSWSDESAKKNGCSERASVSKNLQIKKDSVPYETSFATMSPISVVE